MRSARILAALWLLLCAMFAILEGTLFSALLFTSSLAVGIGCVFLAAAGGRNCEIKIQTPENYSKGEPLFVEISLRNRSRFPIFRKTAVLLCENVLTGNQCRIPLAFIAGSRKEDRIRVELEEPCCGYIRCQIRQCRDWDPFSLFGFSREDKANAGTYILPRIRQIQLDPEQLSAYNMESYLYSSAQKGNDPSETFGIRSYMPGDSPKTIHWKLTGKMGEVVVRELGLPVENSVLVLLDKRRAKGEVLLPEQMDQAVELFLSLSHCLIRQDMSHCLGWQDYRSGHFIIRRVTSAAQLWETCGLLLADPFQEDPVSTAVHYLESCGNLRFASCLYVTAGQDPQAERLEGYCATTVYRAQPGE